MRKEKHALTINIRTVTPQTTTDLDDSTSEISANIQSLKEKPTYVLPGFAYSMIDTFENENFNMVYVHKRTEQDIKV